MQRRHVRIVLLQRFFRLPFFGNIAHNTLNELVFTDLK